MRTKLQRVLAAVLCACMILGMVPVSAVNAEEMEETVVFTEPETVPETQPETVPETQPETIPETVPETVPETIPETEPETTAPTEAEEEPAESVPVETEEVTEATEEPEITETTASEETEPTVPEETEAVETEPVESVPEETGENTEVEEEDSEKGIVDSGTCGPSLTWTLDDEGTLTISGTGTMYSNSSSDPCWYSKRSSIKTVIIDDGVTSIGSYAFHYCSSLTSVTIGNGVTSIGDYAFDGCSAVKTLHISNLESWMKVSLSNLTSNPLSYSSTQTKVYVDGTLLTDLVIPSGTTKIQNYAFRNWDCITSVTIPGSVTSIGDRAFSSCSSLTSVTIPDSVTSIGDSAFYDCSSLTSVTIPDSVTSIGRWAFEDCSSLTSVTIPDSVTSIGSWAFSGCSAVENLYISSLESWMKVSLSGYSSNPLSQSSTQTKVYVDGTLLTDLVIPAGTTTIQYSAFRNWDCISSVTIPDSVTYIDNDAFEDCSSLTSVTIGNSVSSIGSYAFYKCSSLTSITIGNSVSSIRNNAFSSCSSLTHVYFTGSESDWEKIIIGDNNECLLNATIHYSSTGPDDGTDADSGTCGANLTWTLDEEGTLTISGTGSMDDYSDSFIPPWYGERNIIKTIFIENGVTSIGTFAFYKCSNLTDVIIPSSVTYIGDYAFHDCSNLLDVYYEGTESEWGRIEFNTGNHFLTNANIHYNSTGPDKILGKLESIHYLAFSRLAYENWEINETIGEHLKKKHMLDLPISPDGVDPEKTYRKLCKDIMAWKAVKTSDSCGESYATGFYAVTFEGKTKQGMQQVISYRGSTGVDEALWTADGRDDWLKNDLPFCTAHRYTEQLENAKSYYKLNRFSNLTVTGHSLGGSLACVISMTYGVYAEVFNPGSVYEALYLHNVGEMGAKFHGVNSWNLMAHVIAWDIVGAYRTEYRHMPHKHYELHGNDTKHRLGSFLVVNTNGSLSLAPSSSYPIEEAEPYDAPLYLGTSSGDKATRAFAQIPLAGAAVDAVEGGASGAATGAVIGAAEGAVEGGIVAGAPGAAAGAIEGAISGAIDGAIEGATEALYKDVIVTVVDYFTNGFRMYGGDGDDKLSCFGLSSDSFVGGNSTSCDTLNGGWGNDHYYYYKGNGVQYITDDSGADTIHLMGFASNDEITYRQSGGYVTLYCNGNAIIHIDDSRSNFSPIKVEKNGKQIYSIKCFKWSNIGKMIMVACPTDVDIIDANGNVVLTLQNGTETEVHTPYGSFYVGTDENGESVKFLNLLEGYDFRIRGTGDGKMDIVYCENEGVKRAMLNAPVTEAMTATISEGEEPCLMVDADSDGAVDLIISMVDGSVKTPLNISQSYLALNEQGSAQLELITNPAELAKAVRWSVSDSEVLSVDENGVVTGLKAGVAYVIAEAELDGKTYSDRCRIDVVPAGQPIGEQIQLNGVQLVDSKVTTELFQTNYTKVHVLPKLEQNMSAKSFQPDIGAAIESAEFVDPNMAACFHLRVADDRTLEIIPTEKIITAAQQAPKTIRSSYTSTIYLTVDGRTVTTTPLTLTVKKTMPKVKAGAVKINSFLPEPVGIVFTGGTVTGVEGVDLPEGFLVEDGSVTYTGSALKTSAKLNLLLSVEGWAVKQACTVSVSVARTEPTIKLKPTSVTLLPDSRDSAEVAVTISPAQYAGLNIEAALLDSKGVPMEESPVSIFLANGTLTVKPNAGATAGAAYKLSMNVEGSGKKTVLTIRMASAKTKPAVKLKTAGTIDTAIPDSPITLTATMSNFHTGSGERYSARIEKVSKTETVDVTDLLKAQWNGNVLTLTELTAGSLEKGCTYRAVVSVDVTGSGEPDCSQTIKLPVKWSDPARVPVKVTLKAAGTLDVIRPASEITVKPTIQNWFRHEISEKDLVFCTGSGKTLTELTENIPFTIRIEDGTYRIMNNGADSSVKYSVYFSAEIKDAVVTSPRINLNVKTGTAKLTAAPAAMTLLKEDRYDAAEVILQTADTALSEIERVELDAASAKFYAVEYLGNGRCAISFRDSIFQPGTKAMTLKLNVFHTGNLTQKADAAVSVKVTLK